FYLLAVVIAAIRWGQGPAIITSVLSVLAFDFFLIPPYLTLNVHDIQYLFTFAAFLVVGLIVSTLTSKVRAQIIQRQTEKLHSALLSSISHDLKTPLVSITGTLGALLDSKSKLDVQQKNELLETARGESDRLNRIVSNLLDITRTESGVLRISKKPCDLRDFIGACLEQLKDKIDTRDIKINIPRDFPEVNVDFPYMLKAFLNVVDNALKYSPDGSSIEIETSCIGGKARVSVRDYGCGIPKEDLGRIFDKFYRVQRAQNVLGTGLGLSISKNIIEAHGGNISAESILGKGTKFIIELPLE
ncbi:MAG: ATP-binding protein, partial [Candidatus Omnitrophica bacterium]|nr:ATP-binding protein [Candidatus Omnitrophota bacterium]